MAKKGFSPARLVIKVCIVLTIPVVVMSILPGPSGKPVIDVQSMSPSSAVDASQSMLTRAWVSLKQFFNNETVTGKEKVMVYRWIDEHGNLQFSQRPPAPGVNAELIEIKDRSLSMPKPDENLSQILDSYQSSKSGKSSDSEPSGSNLANSGSVKQLMNDAKNVQSMLNERAKVQADY